MSMVSPKRRVATIVLKWLILQVFAEILRSLTLLILIDTFKQRYYIYQLCLARICFEPSVFIFIFASEYKQTFERRR